MNKQIVQYYNLDQPCDFIPLDKPCCLMFNGYKTTKTSIIKKEIEKYNIFNTDKVNLYGIQYKAPLCKKANSTLILNTLIPPMFHNYVKHIFNITILPRICDYKNQKIPVDEAVSKINKLTIITHCYGVFVADYLIKTLDKTLHHLKYTPEEITKINKQLVIISQSPPYLLYNKPATILTFASLADKTTSYQKVFPNVDKTTFICDYNLILTPNIYNSECHDEQKKHKPKDIEHWLWTIKEPNLLSEHGLTTINILKNVLNNAIQRTEINANTDLFDIKSIDTANINVSNVNPKILWNIAKYLITKCH